MAKDAKTVLSEAKAAIQALEDAVNKKPIGGNRNLVILDRGWIFAGNLTEPTPGKYLLTNAVNVRRWQKGGFGQLTRGAASASATLDGAADLRFTESALLFSVSISDGWDNE